jgi:hypothetical protein
VVSIIWDNSMFVLASRDSPVSGKSLGLVGNQTPIAHSSNRPQEPTTGRCHEPDQSNPFHSIFLRSILILSYRLCLCLPSGVFLSGFPIRKLYLFLFTPILAGCLPIVLIILAKSTSYEEGYKLVMKLLIMQFPTLPSLHFPSVQITV